MTVDNVKAEAVAREHGLDPYNIPNHIALIMDGNGRWAHRRGMPRVYGHHKGADRVHEVVEAAGQIGVKALTLFAFSEENWQRNRTEVNAIMGLLRTYIVREKHRLMKNNVRLETIGNLQRLPQANRDLLSDIKEYLSGNNGLTLTLALSYGGRSEIVSACQQIATEVEQKRLNANSIDESLIASKLETAHLPELDLLIRTSGELRVSNFLLWQLAYSELYFSPVFWPDFTRDDFFAAINCYQGRQRRFGKVIDSDEVKVIRPTIESEASSNLCLNSDS